MKNKLEFEGEYLFDKKWNGKGYDENGNIIYEIINGSGKVKEYDIKDMLIFEGEYLNGERNGKGKEFANIKDKIIFEGEYLNGERNGYGKEFSIFNGIMVFEGEFREGKRYGKGIEYNSMTGKKICECEYRDKYKGRRTKLSDRFYNETYLKSHLTDFSSIPHNL